MYMTINEDAARIAHYTNSMREFRPGAATAEYPNACEKLEEKLKRLEASQAEMKRINAYFRKNKTLDGCPDLSEDFIAKMKAAMARDWRTNPQPFESYSLQNNNANIRRVRERIASLKAAAENNQYSETTITEGVKLVENPEIDRIQFLFDGKPDADTRKELKSRGFVWSPKNLAWQRKLTGNGRYAAKQVASFLTA